ncbi:ribosome maturation factor RimM [Actinomycetospora sp. NBRC 106375]|uniref:ribosome maturation factor RimM n=1 Tax=Actinomycetospora sp. NBRC 106375 TaxID=3032207 RepID=UPI0024A229CE|nr:ribosome maturation factor RimM [Actinomycetospora sp. NBRC 106375]GLZ45005.1 ribosome maturation factor RimM [Actinomycetospora sp. NBRC 106375]
MTAPSDDRIVGRVLKAHGLRGELVVEPRTDNVEARFAPGTVLSVRGSRHSRVTVVAARRHGDRLLVTVEGVGDRDGAEALRSAELTAPALDDDPDDPDEFHDHQLEGLTAVLADGTTVGTVTAVLHGAGGELLAIERPDAEEALVPFVAAIVTEVDVPGGRLVLDPPEGLLDGSADDG